MTKEEYKRHVETCHNVIRPSHGGSMDAWKQAVRDCIAAKHPEAASRQKTLKHNRNARIHHAVLTSMGLTRVKGAMGGTYYE